LVTLISQTLSFYLVKTIDGRKRLEDDVFLRFRGLTNVYQKIKKMTIFAIAPQEAKLSLYS